MPTPAEIRALPPRDRWLAAMDHLRDLSIVPAALASLWLLEQALDTWASRVVAHSSMHALIFSRPGDAYPWPVQVRVSWRDGVYEFRLLEGQGGILVSADRCFAKNAPAVLDAFLYQLAGQLAPDPVDDKGRQAQTKLR